MKQILSLLFIALFLNSCGDDSSEKVLNFKLKYDGQDLVFFEDYTYPNGKTIEFTRFSFYISDLKTIKDGVSTDVIDVDYIFLADAHSDAEKASQGFDYIIQDLQDTSFDGLTFNLGLNNAQNATSPNDYASGNPLSESGEYWPGWESYVYVKIEGRMDVDGDGISDGIAFHLGSDDTSRAITINNIQDKDKIEFEIDLIDVFRSASGELYDIESNSRIHSLSQMDQINFLMNNLASAVKLK